MFALNPAPTPRPGLIPAVLILLAQALMRLATLRLATMRLATMRLATMRAVPIRQVRCAHAWS
jgi:hypothetical protein